MEHSQTAHHILLHEFFILSKEGEMIANVIIRGAVREDVKKGRGKLGLKGRGWKER